MKEIEIGITVISIFLIPGFRLEQRDMIELKTGLYKRLNELCIILFFAGVVFFTLQLFKVIETKLLHSLIVPLLALKLHGIMYERFCKKMKRRPKDTFMDYSRTSLDHGYNVMFSVLSTCGGMAITYLLHYYYLD